MSLVIDKSMTDVAVKRLPNPKYVPLLIPIGLHQPGTPWRSGLSRSGMMTLSWVSSSTGACTRCPASSASGSGTIGAPVKPSRRSTRSRQSTVSVTSWLRTTRPTSSTLILHLSLQLSSLTRPNGWKCSKPQDPSEFFNLLAFS